MSETDGPFTVCGVDMAAQPKKTAMCVVTIGRGLRPSISELRMNVDDALIEEAVGASDLTAIDAPLGWPIGFADFVQGQRDITAPPPELREWEPWLRWTDARIAALKLPLSVSSDKIARPAYRAVRLLQRLAGQGAPIDRSGVTGPVIEVYPGAALRNMSIVPVGSYKAGPGGPDNRTQIVGTLRERLGGIDAVAQLGDIDTLLASNDDLLDAFICALVAAARLMGETDPEWAPPADADGLAVARQEGWIHLPRPDALERMRGDGHPNG